MFGYFIRYPQLNQVLIQPTKFCKTSPKANVRRRVAEIEQKIQQNFYAVSDGLVLQNLPTLLL